MESQPEAESSNPITEVIETPAGPRLWDLLGVGCEVCGEQACAVLQRRIYHEGITGRSVEDSDAPRHARCKDHLGGGTVQSIEGMA